MAYFRFRKTRSILPGVRMNLSKSGPSLSVGAKGAKVNISQQGICSTVGLPGSGMSFVDRTSWNALTNSKTEKKQKKNRTNKTVSELMEGMTKDQQRELVTKCIRE